MSQLNLISERYYSDCIAGTHVDVRSPGMASDSRRLRLPDFETTDTCQPYAPAAFIPQKIFLYSFLSEDDSISGPHCSR